MITDLCTTYLVNWLQSLSVLNLGNLILSSTVKLFTFLPQPHPKTPSVPELSLIDEQPILKSATKHYNPMVYQEASCMAQSRIETTVEETATTGQSCLPTDHHQSQSQDENQNSFSLADLESRINMRVAENARQSPSKSDSEENHERAFMEGKDSLARQDEIASEVKARRLPGRDLMPSGHSVTNTANSSVEHGNINTEEKRGLQALSKIAEHEKQLMELQEQVYTFFCKKHSLASAWMFRIISSNPTLNVS